MGLRRARKMKHFSLEDILLFGSLWTRDQNLPAFSRTIRLLTALAVVDGALKEVEHILYNTVCFSFPLWHSFVRGGERYVLDEERKSCEFHSCNRMMPRYRRAQRPERIEIPINTFLSQECGADVDEPSRLLEEPGELPPVVPLDPGGCAVVEAVHADVLVVVAAEDLGNEEPVREITATAWMAYLYDG